MRSLAQRADAITSRLLYGTEPSIDLEIAMNALREWVKETMPDRLALFDMIYVARWNRLREQGWAGEPVSVSWAPPGGGRHE